MIVYKIDVLQTLQAKGYSTYRIRKEKLMGETALGNLRHQEPVSFATLNVICRLTDLNVGDIIEYRPD